MSILLYQPHEVVWALTKITYKVSSAVPSIQHVQKSTNPKSYQKEEGEANAIHGPDNWLELNGLLQEKRILEVFKFDL